MVMVMAIIEPRLELASCGAPAVRVFRSMYT